MNSQISTATDNDTTNDDDTDFMLSLQEERRFAAKTLEEIGLIEAHTPFDLWQQYSQVSVTCSPRSVPG